LRRSATQPAPATLARQEASGLTLMEKPLEHALERELATFLHEEYASQGEELYQWYRLRFVPRDIGLAPYNVAIADFVTEHCGEFGRCIEIGAGIGQQSMLLALRKRQTLMIDANFEIFAMATRAFERIANRVYPELPTYMTMIYDWFPDRAPEYVTPDSILCFPTLSWSTTPEQDGKILDTIGSAGAVILSLRQFYRPRDLAEEQSILVEQIRTRGFDPPIDVCVWQEPVDGFMPDRIVFMKKSAKIRRSLFARLGISN
jgi:hypothetical protein